MSFDRTDLVGIVVNPFPVVGDILDVCINFCQTLHFAPEVAEVEIAESVAVVCAVDKLCGRVSQGSLAVLYEKDRV